MGQITDASWHRRVERDVTIMAAKVALLTLVTGLFIAVWSGDQPDQIASIKSDSIDWPVYNSIDPQSLSAHTRSLWSNPIATETIHSSRVVLPSGISAGTYLVVDHQGQNQIHTVSSDHLTNLGHDDNTTGQNHYFIQVGQHRWHFIRIEHPPVRQITSVPTTVR